MKPTSFNGDLMNKFKLLRNGIAWVGISGILGYLFLMIEGALRLVGELVVI